MTHTFTGPYENWDIASKFCSGYEQKKILKKVLSTSIEVQKGNFLFERDSIGFKKPFFDWPIVATLLHEASLLKGNLRVLDFGGSLGSTFFQHRPLLSHCNLSWHIIEQKHFVEAGNKYFKSNSLHFYESIEECVSSVEIDVVILSGVIQYLKNPTLLIDKILKIKANKIIIDKTMVNKTPHNLVYVQNVPPKIYNASYPCYSLSEKALIDKFTVDYELLSDFQSLPFKEVEDINSSFKGFLFTKKKIDL